MGWNNPPVSWSELERRLSATVHTAGMPLPDGGDSPAMALLLKSGNYGDADLLVRAAGVIDG